MPYPHQRIVPLKEPVYIFTSDAEKLQIALTKAQRERSDWKNKYQVVSLENAKIQKQLREKDDLIKILEQHATQVKQEDVFFSSHIPPASGALKRIINQLTLENARLKRQKGEIQSETGSSSRGAA